MAAAKAGKLAPAAFDALVTCMITLNDVGVRLWAAGASAATDVTGFGLSGHALEMALGADVKLTIDTASLPQLPDAQALCGAGFTCGGTNANAVFTQARCLFSPSLPSDMIGLVHDPQTSGGLLIAVPAERCDELIAVVNVMTKITAAPSPAAVSMRFETARNEHIPRKFASRMLLVKMAAIRIRSGEISFMADLPLPCWRRRSR